MIVTRFYENSKFGFIIIKVQVTVFSNKLFTLEIIDVNVSQRLEGTKVRYVQATYYEDPRRNSEENEEFLSESSKRKEAMLFQFK